jgi:hypothetical protein
MQIAWDSRVSQCGTRVSYLGQGWDIQGWTQRGPTNQEKALDGIKKDKKAVGTKKFAGKAADPDIS